MSISATKRILVKMSWEVLSWESGIFDYQNIDKIAQKLVSLSKKWFEIVVVCWAWNIWRRRDTIDAWIERVKSDHLWMMATVMNAVLLNERVIQNWWWWVVFCPSWTHIPPITKEYNALTARKKLKQWKMVFCAWWTWNPYSTTDSWAVLRALELECEMVVKATKVDGVYTADPNKDPSATKYDTITYEEWLERGVKIMDQSALWMAKEEKMPIFVCHVDDLEKIVEWYDHWTRVISRE